MSTTLSRGFMKDLRSLRNILILRISEITNAVTFPSQEEQLIGVYPTSASSHFQIHRLGLLEKHEGQQVAFNADFRLSTEFIPLR